MKYLFNVSEAYWVEADSEDQAKAKLQNNFDEYRPSWQEITFVEEEEDE